MTPQGKFIIRGVYRGATATRIIIKGHRHGRLGCGKFVPASVWSLSRGLCLEYIFHFLDVLNIDKANVVGRLFGASLAIEMAVINFERVNKLVLCDCLHVPPEELKKARDDFQNEGVVFQEDGSHLITVWKGCGKRTGVDLEMVQRATIRYLQIRFGYNRVGDSHRAKFAYDVTPKLPKIKCWVLLLYSQKSHFYPRMEVTKKLIPNRSAKLIISIPSIPTWKNQELHAGQIEFLQNSKYYKNL